ncbi:hypothetical protein U9M48_004602, partial [Paspalum notatum var. saurae]
TCLVRVARSSSTVLNWCMTELVRSPAAMAKVQSELRNAFKGRNTITEDDIEGLCYLKLVIKEALRLHTSVPLLLPRVCREACQIMSYDIPKGMVVFVNTWAICRDPKYWDEPEVFRPERSESIDLDYKLQVPPKKIAPAQQPVVLLALSVPLLLAVLFSKLKSLLVSKPKLKLPPGPWTLPVIGNLHQLVTSANIYRAMRGLAQRHGPLMVLRLGEVPVTVVSSPEAAQEVMKAHDVKFADRFLNATLTAFTFNGNNLTLARYGERWRHLRKMCVVELLSATRVRSFRRIREEEVARVLESLAATAGAGSAVDLSKMISGLINDTFVRESIGSRCKYRDEYLDAIGTAIRQTSILTVADLFPSSRLMQGLGTAPRKVLACRDRIQRILEQIIHEETEAMDRGDEEAAESFVSVVLKVQKERTMPIPLTNDTMVAVMFRELVDRAELVHDRASPISGGNGQSAVRVAFKGRNTITEDDVEGLCYLKLVIKEALRLHTPVPLLLPRVCREACQIMGYDIPKGMVVFVNAWAICRDPKYWDEPEVFRPERFESIDLDYKGTNFEFLPFGSGRRSCPGINLGLSNIELALASLLYHFDWKLPDGIEPEDVDISEAAGLVANKKA